MNTRDESGDINNRELPPARAAGICRWFATPDGRLEVLRGIDWTARRGETSAIVGASGVGKSTFLHIVGGLDAPSAGQIFWEERSPYDLSEEARARYRNRTVGFVFQFHHLLPEFTAEENVALPLIIGGTKLLFAIEVFINSASLETVTMRSAGNGAVSGAYARWLRKTKAENVETGRWRFFNSGQKLACR